MELSYIKLDERPRLDSNSLFRLRDNSVNVDECSPFRVGTSTLSI